MKTYICTVCGHNHVGDDAPDNCPQCGAPKAKFKELAEISLEWADQHVVGSAIGVDKEVVEGLRENFTG